MQNPHGDLAVRIAVAFTVVGNLFVLCRLYIRLFLIRTPGIEDLCITIAMLLSTAFTILIKVQANSGLGMHVWDLTEEQLLRPLKALFASILCYYLAFSFIKASFLFQFYRIFPRPRMRKIIYFTAAFIFLFGIETVIMTIFLCIPVQKFWEPNIDGFCFDKKALWFTQSALHIITDMMILLLPMSELKHLNMPRRQKRALIFVFALGFFACATSIVRLQSLIHLTNGTDLTYDNAATATWSAGELNISLICANVPAMRPLLVRLVPRLLGGSTQQSSQGPVELSRSRSGWRKFPASQGTIYTQGTVDRSGTDQATRGGSDDEIPLQSKCWATERFPEGVEDGVIKVCTDITRETEVGSVSDEGHAMGVSRNPNSR
ncbi:hypothetical protein ACJ41O_000763 [Fusarium nematophilum]